MGLGLGLELGLGLGFESGWNVGDRMDEDLAVGAGVRVRVRLFLSWKRVTSKLTSWDWVGLGLR